MIRLTVLPHDGTPYITATKGAVITYDVRWPDESVTALNVTVRAFEPEWAPNDVVRVEGVTKLTTGIYRVIGYYQINSTESPLGILEIQGA